MGNPYKPKMTDEASGIEVSNPLYKAWQEGYEKGVELLKLTGETQFKADIQEVVEWINSKREGGYNFCVKIGWDEWQSKLKSWGFEIAPSAGKEGEE